MRMSARELLRSTHLSYSKLQTYRQCPMRFRLEYLEECPTEPSLAIQLGLVVHAVIAHFEAGGLGAAPATSAASAADSHDIEKAAGVW